MRVSQCCCGCSLRTGTLILLWLDLIGSAGQVVKLAVAATSSHQHFSFLDSAMLGWGCIVLVIAIYGIIGVEKHRPSYLLPYVGRYVFSLAVDILFILVLWIGSAAMRDEIIDSMSKQIAMGSPKDREYSSVYRETSINGESSIYRESSMNKGPSKEDLEKIYNGLVTGMSFGILILIALTAYFLCVVYSYYKLMQEEDKGIFQPAAGTGIVYAAPTDQNKGYVDCPPAYAQQPAAAPYPQNAGYPQQVGGYPNLQQNAGYPQQQFPSYPQKQ